MHIENIAHSRAKHLLVPIRGTYALDMEVLKDLTLSWSENAITIQLIVCLFNYCMRRDFHFQPVIEKTSLRLLYHTVFS